MDLELGKSPGKQDASASSKFNAFLKRIEHGRDFETLRKKDITVDLIGNFCSFLLQDDISWQTPMNYLSSIERKLETGIRIELFKKESDWCKDAAGISISSTCYRQSNLANASRTKPL
jgi:hypothetical protein